MITNHASYSSNCNWQGPLYWLTRLSFNLIGNEPFVSRKALFLWFFSLHRSLFLGHFVKWRDIDKDKMLSLIWVQGVLISSKLAAAWHLEVLFIFKQFCNSWSEISSKIASFYDNQQLSSSEYALWFFFPHLQYMLIRKYLEYSHIQCFSTSLSTMT